jgi:hypothetical protein
MNTKELVFQVRGNSGGTDPKMISQELAIQLWEDDGGAIGRPLDNLRTSIALTTLAMTGE